VITHESHNKLGRNGNLGQQGQRFTKESTKRGTVLWDGGMSCHTSATPLILAVPLGRGTSMTCSKDEQQD